MIYEIQSRSDFLSGASLTVMIPEDELDKKALYTLQADKPEFILPFHYRSVDGQVEFVYKIGSHSKMQYLSGVRSPKEYAMLWAGVLNPLLDCGDWFMKPYSFVLNVEYLYFDKNKNTICYIYIPSLRDCSEHSAIKEMAAEFSKRVPVTDVELENRVLRTIMKNFNPKGFLQMLESYVAAAAPAPPPRPMARTGAEGRPEQIMPKPTDAPAPKAGRTEQRGRVSSTAGDIIIDIPIDVPAKSGSTKKEKGAVAEPRPVQHPPVSVVSHPIPHVYQRHPSNSPAYPVLPIYPRHADANNITQSLSVVTSGSRLKLVGSVLLPPVIDVRISSGGVFTIGRFDAAVGRQQSSFEFDKKTKAVSRRHAAIEREANRYKIIDLSSSAGTFINGHKLPPNAPCVLGHGCRISFGNAGADYVWEECD